jgi:chromosome segregation ATPase
MFTSSRRIFGIFLAILALLGIFFSAWSIWGVIQLRGTLTPKIEAGIDLVDKALTTTDQALDVLDSTLKTINTNVLKMREALDTLGQSVHDAVPILTSLSTLTGETLPDTISATQSSLTTAQTTAKTIEDILRVISRIPLMPGEPYNPEVPLDTTLGQVAADLENIKPQLTTIEQDLKDSKANLSGLEADIIQVSLNLLLIKDDLAAAADVIDQYHTLIADVQTRLDSLKTKLPTWVSILTGFVLFLLAWIVIYQVDLLIRGIRLVRNL